MMDDFKIYNTIRFRREALGLTQRDFGKLVGVSKNTISSIERGEFNPSLVLIVRMLLVFNCSFEELFLPAYYC